MEKVVFAFVVVLIGAYFYVLFRSWLLLSVDGRSILYVSVGDRETVI
jgi:hypothetical protein